MSIEKPTIEQPETNKARIILEVGAGLFPSPYGMSNKPDDNTRYIAIEPSQTKTKRLNAVLRHEERKDVIRARGEALPIASEKINEVILQNVIGDPRITEKEDDREGLETSLKDIISEIHRVLQDGGVVHIIETYTPNWQKPDDVRLLFEKNGFKLENSFNAGDHHYGLIFRR